MVSLSHLEQRNQRSTPPLLASSWGPSVQPCNTPFLSSFSCCRDKITPSKKFNQNCNGSSFYFKRKGWGVKVSGNWREELQALVIEIKTENKSLISTNQNRSFIKLKTLCMKSMNVTRIIFSEGRRLYKMQDKFRLSLKFLTIKHKFHP